MNMSSDENEGDDESMRKIEVPTDSMFFQNKNVILAPLAIIRQLEYEILEKVN